MRILQKLQNLSGTVRYGTLTENQYRQSGTSPSTNPPLGLGYVFSTEVTELSGTGNGGLQNLQKHVGYGMEVAQETVPATRYCRHDRTCAPGNGTGGLQTLQTCRVPV